MVKLPLGNFTNIICRKRWDIAMKRHGLWRTSLLLKFQQSENSSPSWAGSQMQHVSFAKCVSVTCVHSRMKSSLKNIVELTEPVCFLLTKTSCSMATRAHCALQELSKDCYRQTRQAAQLQTKRKPGWCYMRSGLHRGLELRMRQFLLLESKADWEIMPRGWWPSNSKAMSNTNHYRSL